MDNVVEMHFLFFIAKRNFPLEECISYVHCSGVQVPLLNTWLICLFLHLLVFKEQDPTFAILISTLYRQRLMLRKVLLSTGCDYLLRYYLLSLMGELELD